MREGGTSYTTYYTGLHPLMQVSLKRLSWKRSLPGCGCDSIHHEVYGLGGSKLNSLSQHVHKLGNWERRGERGGGREVYQTELALLVRAVRPAL